jgi:predicted O-linked N-acetylglucosamine transferase (SPINDLY family)
MDVRTAWAQGQGFHKAGDLVRAEEAYRAVLREDPSFAQAWYLLGALCESTRRMEEAITCLKEAIRLRPEHASTWNMLGVALARKGRSAEAEACFRRVLQLRPGDLEASGNLGRARWEQGQLAVVMAGASSRSTGTAWPPGSFEACFQRGYELRHQGRLGEAEAWYHQALQLRPDSADTLCNLGTVLFLQARLEEAETYFRRTIAGTPDHFLSHLNLAATLLEMDRVAEAEVLARRAVQLQPQNATGYNNLGLTLHRYGRTSEAEACFLEAVRLSPDYVQAYTNLGAILLAQCRAPEAEACCARILELDPHFVPAHSNLLMAKQYIPGVTAASLAEAHEHWDRRHAAPLRETHQTFRNDPDADRPLRLGFVSFDFNRHPVGYFLVRTLEGLRPLACETYGYAVSSTRDDLTDRMSAAATVWRQARGLTDTELADQIRADRIDLLFDLGGHTHNNRLLVFARKPAPIQLTWMGYVGTTGLSAMDYLIADRHEVPEGSECHYRERVIRLPDGYICYDPPVYAPAVRPLPASAKGHVTFGCFNSPAKIGPDVLAVWAKILLEMPGSRLLLKYKGLDDREVGRKLRGFFASRGVAPERIELQGWSAHADALATYGRVDIALDTFPYSGGLTTCEALWMGIPVLTWPGETFAGRHSLSHLSNVGLEETVARDLSHYVEIAVGLARDLSRLAGLRQGLRPRMAGSPLCDGHRLARNLLASLRDPWREWCKDQAR